MRRGLEANEEKVFQIMEYQESRTEYIGRALLSKYGVMVYKGDMRCFITWEEMELFQGQRPTTNAT